MGCEKVLMSFPRSRPTSKHSEHSAHPPCQRFLFMHFHFHYHFPSFFLSTSTALSFSAFHLLLSERFPLLFIPFLHQKFSLTVSQWVGGGRGTT